MEKLVSKNYIDRVLDKLSGKEFINSNGISKDVNFLIIPYEKKFASLARLEAFKNVCSCIYIDMKKNVWFSTNKISKETAGNQGFLKNLSFIREYLYNLQKNEKSAKENLLLSAFKEDNEIFKSLSQRYYSTLLKAIKYIKNKKDKSNLKTLKILNMIRSEFFEMTNLEQRKIFNHSRCLLNEINEYFNSIETLEPPSRDILSVISSVGLYIEDILNIYEISLNKKEEKIFLEAYWKGNIKRANCNSQKNLHCEQRMLEHISKEVNDKIINENVCLQVANSVEKGLFVVSKFCCGYCYSVFSSLESVAIKNVNFNSKNKTDKLGHSCAFFSGWESPLFKNAGLFSELREKIHEKLDFCSRLNAFEEGPLIENSETERLVNQILVPEAFII